MTKETSKNTSTRKKAPVKGDILAQEHGFSESGQTFIISQLTRISADLNNFQSSITKELDEFKSDTKADLAEIKKDVGDLKSNQKATDTKLETLEKHLPTIWQILGAFALFSGVIITALKVL